ncbi:MAG: inosine/xanthosine triphosphatase [Ardenticatenaceae bacterium]|nr:inosine/xanthosine triphosphatase [Anaerolineales bacterium]MCB8922847.1 inosine/xanthosine triphosphatase [Ardenticatenaceae bacterium]MCB9005426.1 inosine/xanthosine triphosphatase [Ardenticatenaceae bacterium]
MRIAVGSTNPVKVAAVRDMALRHWPEAEVVPLAVETGVSEMPMSDAESLAGARNRARAARAAANADLGVGLEGGVNPEEIGLVLHGWVVVVDGNGRTGIGGAGRLPLPEAIAKRVLAGEELGPVMDDILGQTDVRKKGGAVGALTAGLVMRQDAFALGVAYALAPFVAAQLY